MAATGHLVVLVALIAAVAGYRRDDDSKCTEDMDGYVTQQVVILKSIKLKPNVATWDLTVDSGGTCKTLDAEVSALYVRACDPDAPDPPSVVVRSLTSATVARNTNLQAPPTVEVQVYCQS